MTELPQCECQRPPDTGWVYCHRYQRNMERWPWEVCSGQCTFAACPEDYRARYISTWLKLPSEPRRCAPDPPPDDGPGTELEKLLADLRAPMLPGCQCAKAKEDMNRLGCGGCRERQADLAARLRQQYDALTCRQKLLCFIHGLRHPWFWRLDLCDPASWLVREAIRRTDNNRHRSRA